MSTGHANLLEITDANFEKEVLQSPLPVLVDFTASWCPPCQQMRRAVFPNPAIGDLLNTRFIPVQLDVDRDEVKAVAASFRVELIPALFILNSDGSIQSAAHAMNPEEMRAFLNPAPH